MTNPVLGPPNVARTCNCGDDAFGDIRIGTCEKCGYQVPGHPMPDGPPRQNHPPLYNGTKSRKYRPAP